MTFYFNGQERICGWEEYPTHFASGLLVFWAVLLGLLITYRKSSGQENISSLFFNIDSRLTPWILCIILLVITYTIQLTYSRSSLLTLYLLLSVTLLLKLVGSIRSKSLSSDLSDSIFFSYWTLLFVGTLCLTIHTPQAIERGASSVDLSEGSVANRLLYWRYGGAMLLDNFWGNLDSATLSKLYNQVYSPPTQTATWQPGKYIVSNLVNTPLTLAYRYGIPLASVLIGLYFFLIYQLIVVYRLTKSNLYRTISCSCLIALVASAIAMQFIWIGTGVYYPWIIISLCFFSFVFLCVAGQRAGQRILRKCVISLSFFILFFGISLVLYSFLMRQILPIKPHYLFIQAIPDAKNLNKNHCNSVYCYQLNKEPSEQSRNIQNQQILITASHNDLLLRKQIEGMLNSSPSLTLLSLPEKSKLALQLALQKIEPHIDQTSPVYINAEGYIANLIIGQTLNGELLLPKGSQLHLSNVDLSLGKSNPIETIEKLRTSGELSKLFLPEISLKSMDVLSGYEKALQQEFLENYNDLMQATNE